MVERYRVTGEESSPSEPKKPDEPQKARPFGPPPFEKPEPDPELPQWQRSYYPRWVNPYRGRPPEFPQRTTHRAPRPNRRAA